MITYRTAPAAAEEDEAGRWAAAFPAGPMVHLSGAAPLILDVLHDCSRPLTLTEACAELRDLVDDIPEDLEQVVGTFLEQLAELGLLIRQEGP